MASMEFQANESGYYECATCQFSTKFLGNYRRHVKTPKHEIAMSRHRRLENMKETSDPTTTSFSDDNIIQPVRLLEVVDMFLKHQVEMMKVNVESQQIQHTEMFRALTDRVMAHEQQLAAVAAAAAPPPPAALSSLQNVMLDHATSMQTNAFATTTASSNNNSSSNNNNTNSNNRKFNLNLYLNEECKNAPNLADFVREVVISMEDLEHLGQVGYVQGMTKILTKALSSTYHTERPMHCTDVKRATIYVKQNDAWKKDIEQEQTIKAIERIAHNHMKTFKEWRDLHPNFAVSDTEDYETWYRISRNLCNTDPAVMKKLVQHLATITAIEKGEMVLSNNNNNS
jgi:hypothetical protein